jgi:6-pyruvoyltetrahydropterin/6-carboxytetrahydropterin synthase
VIVYVTVRQQFNAGHRLHNPALGEEENRRLYGRCNLPSGHGHNYLLEVTLRGEVDPAVGAFVNAEELRSWLWSELLDRIDHRHLNSDVDFLRGVVPTSENLARALYQQIARGPYGRWLHEVRIHESENNLAGYRLEAEEGGSGSGGVESGGNRSVQPLTGVN